MNKTAYLQGYMEKTAKTPWRSWLTKQVKAGNEEEAVLQSLLLAARNTKTGSLPTAVKTYNPDWNIIRAHMTGREPVSEAAFIKALKRGSGYGKDRAVTFRPERRLGAYIRELKSKAMGRKTGNIMPTWSDMVGLDPEAYVTVKHSGTAPYIDAFLQGKARGYPLEGGGMGLQVHPIVEGNTFPQDRALHYGRVAQESTGLPAALMTGRIKGKYLRQANLGYEAGLTPANIKHLKDVKIEKYT